MRKELPSPDGWTPVKVVGSGKQFGPNTLEAPKDDQDGRSELGHEKNGRVRELGRRALVVATAFAFGVGALFGLGHAADAVKANTTGYTCRGFEIGNPESVPGVPGTVIMNKEDRESIGGFLDEKAGGLDVSALSIGMPQPVGEFSKGPTLVCVSGNAVDGVNGVDIVRVERMEEASSSDSAAEFSAVIPGNPESDDPESD